MEPSKLIAVIIILSLSTCNGKFQALFIFSAANSKLFREYIGAESDSVKLTDMPINSDVEVHFILAFAIDYANGTTNGTTNGKFNVFWKTNNLKPADIVSIKNKHRNVKVAVSLGGDSVDRHQKAYFKPKSISSWVNNAVSSLTQIIKQYNLDGIDIDYEHFRKGPNTFALCIGQLISTLKSKGVISFASIAPFDDGGPVQSHYLALWKKYGRQIDYVNFQFYAYDKGIGVSQFLSYFDAQASNYNGGKVLASFISGGDGGLGPSNGFFEACNELKKQRKLEGIFVWCADESKKYGFRYEKQSQDLLASA
ncbi:chitinase 2-like protein [Cinnamomum micranthum f. kanehirae]|uniref:Chitinase 2-like protein n=1 Tax=Cinnamomum micranthum f. kanehirae TaxID=337451 RepID=A0A443NEC3_9MAGN|nr:chitinase 2-like protein [Cinnamomum micranthum f. kanehirae]